MTPADLPPPADRQCQRCIFWEKLLDGKDGEPSQYGVCHRFPPFKADPDHKPFWLYMFATEWCGEIQLARPADDGEARP